MGDAGKECVFLMESLANTVSQVHEWHGTFRGAIEWRALFGLIGFTIEQELPISDWCHLPHRPPFRKSTLVQAQALIWPRAMWVLKKA